MDRVFSELLKTPDRVPAAETPLELEKYYSEFTGKAEIVTAPIVPQETVEAEISTEDARATTRRRSIRARRRPRRRRPRRRAREAPPPATETPPPVTEQAPPPRHLSRPSGR